MIVPMVMMDQQTDADLARLRQVYDDWLVKVPLEHRGEVERMYQAFKARLLIEWVVERRGSGGVDLADK